MQLSLKWFGKIILYRRVFYVCVFYAHMCILHIYKHIQTQRERGGYYLGNLNAGEFCMIFSTFL